MRRKWLLREWASSVQNESLLALRQGESAVYGGSVPAPPPAGFPPPPPVLCRIPKDGEKNKGF